MRLAVGILLVVLGLSLLVGIVLYARKHPRRALRDLGFWGIVDSLWSDGFWTYLIPPGLILLGIMVIVTELWS